MHLAANAIGHLVGDGTGDLQMLTHDLDEVLSHVIWHAALIGLSALIVWRALQHPPLQRRWSARSLAALALAPLLFGFTFFAMVVEGPEAVRVVRAMMGATNPLEAAPGTVRGDFGLSVLLNVVHSADSLESAKREIQIYFPEGGELKS